MLPSVKRPSSRCVDKALGSMEVLDALGGFFEEQVHLLRRLALGADIHRLFTEGEDVSEILTDEYWRQHPVVKNYQDTTHAE